MDKNYKQKVRQDLNKTFAHDNRPMMEKVKGWLGIEEKKQPAGVKPASYSPWERMKEDEGREK